MLDPDSFVFFETMTATDGSFALDLLPPGTYSLVAVHGNSVGYIQAFAVSREHHPTGRRKIHEIVLMLAGSIAGRVTCTVQDARHAIDLEIARLPDRVSRRTPDPVYRISIELGPWA